MNKVSIALNVCYGDDYGKKTYLPMLYELGENLEKCYGVGFPRGYEFGSEPVDKMFLTKIPRYLKRFIYHPFCKLTHRNDFYALYWQSLAFDRFVASRLKDDGSNILFTKANMCETIKRAKVMGKKIVIFGADSEPRRQYDRYISECKLYKIQNKMGYGFPEFRDSYEYGYKNADKIVSISELSKKTYVDAGYDESIIKVIPLIGSRFEVGIRPYNGEKQKAFISTAFHSILKGTHRLLEAWEKAKIEDIPLIIIGNLYGDMQEYVKNHAPFHNVIFAGNQNDLKKYYTSLDAVGILFSFSEAAVRVTPEMLSMGFPMIVSRDATCDIVKNGVNGFIVDQTNIDEVVEKLHYFSDDWNRVHQMQGNAINSVNNTTTTDFGREVGAYLKQIDG